ncbi:hypothetical protein clem_04430 [Legionella clemsonensis]|uniref:Uncharacterized protein n=1 Tax=Legionella clemsonensis TaxID=1867846 RepID=A0A222P0S0_9GAMM|nr:hypothetical protein clem_04430 [Legionella clemsonensis]
MTNRYNKNSSFSSGGEILTKVLPFVAVTKKKLNFFSSLTAMRVEASSFPDSLETLVSRVFCGSGLNKVSSVLVATGLSYFNHTHDT